VARLFERVTIAGVGLIGGSLGLAARAAGLVGEIVGLGRGAANLELARARGIVDRYSHDPAEAARDADLLVLAVPVARMAAVAQACAPVLRHGAVVTDVGSVKESVVREVEAVLPPHLAFVGAHPIAGTEESGAAAAFADVFRGARCVLTPSRRSTADAVARVRALWEGVGMRVEALDPSYHDQVLAWVSHLPHALAFSLVNGLLDVDPAMQRFGGPSFRDATRVASSSVDTWTEIFLCNAQLDAVLGAFARTLEALRAAVARRDAAAVRAALARAQGARRDWSGSGA